jgi:uncharacterized phage protein (TIGR02218 family)
MKELEPFNKAWFEKHQAKLVWLLNAPTGRKRIRRLMGVPDSLLKVKRICGIGPSWIIHSERTLQRGNGKVVERKGSFASAPRHAEAIRRNFYPVWLAMHSWDWFADWKLPELSFGFSTLGPIYPVAGAVSPCDGSVYSSDASWTTARNGTGATPTTSVSAVARAILAEYSGGVYNIRRVFHNFDTSPIGSTSTVSALTLTLYGDGITANHNEDDSGYATMHIVAGTPATSDNLIPSDFTQVGSTSFANMDFSTYGDVGGQPYAFNLNSSGIAAINKIGVTCYVALTAADLNNTAPTGTNINGMIHADYSGYWPQLDVTYTTGSGTAPSITSANNTTFTVGASGSFTVNATGTPSGSSMTFSKTGTLPSGVTFVDSGTGHATISGTPATGTAGSYPITITASNGVTPDATQSFTLTVSSGAAMTITKTGSLPSGVTFVDNGNGTATLSGTPAAGTVGSYPITITANNGTSPNATQNFTLVISASGVAPTITSSNNATFSLGASSSFTVSATGSPIIVFTKSGSLPSGITFTDNGNGTATISGTPSGAAGDFPITITANNGVTPNATQSFVLHVIGGGVWYVSPTGSSTGDGSIGNPWDLHTIFGGNPGFGGTPAPSVIQPGDIIYCRGGTYTLPKPFPFESMLAGTAGNQITIKPYPGERAIWDQNADGSADANGIVFSMAYVDVWGIIILNSQAADRTTWRPNGISQSQFGGRGVRLIHCWIMDCGNGFEKNDDADTLEMHFCCFMNNGWDDRTTGLMQRGTGHGFYGANNDASPYTKMYDCVFTGGFGYGVHIYSGGTGHLYHFDLQRTVSYCNGYWTRLAGDSDNYYYPEGRGTANFLVGHRVVQDFTALNNVSFHRANRGGGAFQFGMSGYENQNATVQYNRFLGQGAFSVEKFETLDFRYNYATLPAPINNRQADYTRPSTPVSINWDYNEYYFNPSDTSMARWTLDGTDMGDSGWQGAGLDTHSTIHAYGLWPSSPTVTLNRSTFDTNIAHLIIENPSGASVVNADLSAMFNPGDPYTIINCQDLMGTPVASGTYSGPVPINMATLNCALPVGATTPGSMGTLSPVNTVNSAPYFGAFVVLRQGVSGVPPTITSSNNTSFTTGSAGTFNVITVGDPTMVITKTGSLPSGVTFTDNGNGTATIAGTAASGTAGDYVLTITANNGIPPNATQTFTLHILPLTVTSNRVGNIESKSSAAVSSSRTPNIESIKRGITGSRVIPIESFSNLKVTKTLPIASGKIVKSNAYALNIEARAPTPPTVDFHPEPPATTMIEDLQRNVGYIIPIWKIISRDGLVAAYTSHTRTSSGRGYNPGLYSPQPFLFNGINYLATSAYAAQDSHKIGLSPSSTEINGVFDSIITKQDVEGGRWKLAKIVFEYVDYLNLSLGSVSKIVGVAGAWSTNGPTYKVEMLSNANLLQQLIGDTTSPTDRQVFPAGLNRSAWTVTRNVTTPAPPDRRHFTVDGATIPDHYYENGVAIFLTGDNNLYPGMEIKDNIGNTIELELQMPADIVAGNQVSLLAGYDGTRQQNKARFDDMIDFDGEPDLPGLKTLMSYPE